MIEQFTCRTYGQVRTKQHHIVPSFEVAWPALETLIRSGRQGTIMCSLWRERDGTCLLAFSVLEHGLAAQVRLEDPPDGFVAVALEMEMIAVTTPTEDRRRVPYLVMHFRPRGPNVL